MTVYSNTCRRQQAEITRRIQLTLFSARSHSFIHGIAITSSENVFFLLLNLNVCRFTSKCMHEMFCVWYAHAFDHTEKILIFYALLLLLHEISCKKFGLHNTFFSVWLCSFVDNQIDQLFLSLIHSLAFIHPFNVVWHRTTALVNVCDERNPVKWIRHTIVEMRRLFEVFF